MSAFNDEQDVLLESKVRDLREALRQCRTYARQARQDLLSPEDNTAADEGLELVIATAHRALR